MCMVIRVANYSYAACGILFHLVDICFMNSWKTLLAIAVTVTVVVACANEETPSKASESKVPDDGITVVNGVERSELALTMRDMYDQMKLVKDSLKAGVAVQTNYLERYKRIHTDRATEPEKIDEVYNGMATLFISKYEAFERAVDTNKVEAFNQMLDACLACHQHKCPGPVKAIKKLKLNAG